MASDDRFRGDRLGLRFARTLEILTGAGLLVTIVGGLAYLAGGAAVLSTREVVAHWGLSSAEFWREAAGIRGGGYGWLVERLGRLDAVSLVGVVVLAAAPAIALLVAVPATKGRRRALLLCLVAELLLAAVAAGLLG